jgi:hypothetical protein
VALDRCLFAALPGAPSDLERRIERLVSFYAPLGARGAVVEPLPDGALVGWIEFREAAAAGDRAGGSGEPAVFGEDLPRPLRHAEALLRAGEAELRTIEGAVAALASDGSRARLVCGAGAPTMLYAAGGRAWSTHAVAAAVLARGGARLDSARVPELLAAELVGGDRTLVSGVEASPAATVVDLDAGARERSFWPREERWAPLPEADARARAADALLAGLERRLEGAAHPRFSLTGGLDSRVVAVALRELGIEAEAFTWGEPDWPDVQAAAAIARALGVPHRHLPFEWLDDAPALALARAEARFTEGAIHLGPARIGWPAPMGAFVTGAGGEAGRAFYYRQEAPRDGADPPAARVAQAMTEPLRRRIAGARPEAVSRVEQSVREWIADAERLGYRGWRALDVVYAEQRVRRWLRGMIPRSEGAMVPAFATPDALRALVSLPLDDRLSDGFHRAFLAERRPELVPPAAPAAERTGIASRLRGAVARRLRPRGAVIGGRWEERPAFREWIADGVLGAAPIVEAMGERWCDRTRRRFLAGDGDAETLALWAAGPAALDAALAEVRE